MSKKIMVATSFAMAAAFAFTGCSGGAPAGGGESEGAVEINVLGYAALFEDKYTEAVISQFEAEHENITVNFIPAQNSAEMLGKLRSEAGSPTVDVAILDASVANTGNKEGLFSKISSSDVPNVEGSDARLGDSLVRQQVRPV
ncbi:MAG: extracellular solute-binding protein, partial [Microbacteriaceae bacterium]